MANEWPEPCFRTDDPENIDDLANQFETFYRDVFTHTLKNPTARAPARYVMDVLFQVNKIIALKKREALGESSVSDACPEARDCETTPEENRSTSSGFNKATVSEAHQAEQAGKNENTQPEAPLTNAIVEDKPVEEKSVHEYDHKPDELDSDEDDSDWTPQDSDEETDDDSYEYNEGSAVESDGDIEEADEPQEHGGEDVLYKDAPVADQPTLGHDCNPDELDSEEDDSDWTPEDSDEEGDDFYEYNEGSGEESEGEAKEAEELQGLAQRIESNHTDGGEQDEASEIPGTTAPTSLISTSTQGFKFDSAEQQPDKTAHHWVRIRWDEGHSPCKGFKASQGSDVRRELLEMINTAFERSGYLDGVWTSVVRPFSKSGDVDILFLSQDTKDTVIQFAEKWVPYLMNHETARLPCLGPRQPCRTPMWLKYIPAFDRTIRSGEAQSLVWLSGINRPLMQPDEFNFPALSLAQWVIDQGSQDARLRQRYEKRRAKRQLRKMKRKEGRSGAPPTRFLD